jgi:UDP-N-acetyl-D-mannosaminuronic acid dehydrogenase
MRVAVVGMGYVGIPAAALFADVPGFQVTGIQRRSKRSGWKIDALNRGENPIGGDEPGLEELIQRVHKKGTFKVTDDISSVKDADAILIDVQTPTELDHQPRYESLISVSEKVGEFMRPGTLVCIESTVAPGTTQNLVLPILEKASGMKCGQDFSLAFAYERVMVGRLLYNITDLPRIVGGVDPDSTNRAVALYENIVKAELHPTDSLTAEVSKTVENTYRDVNIAFANEVAIICESLGIDSFRVRELVNTLPNIPGDPSKNPVRNMHVPGSGVGGHCLPKDSWLLKFGLDEYGDFPFEPKIIVSSRELNDWMPIHCVDLLEEELDMRGRSLSQSKIAILGLAFLPNSDDTRNTPTYAMDRELRERGASVIIHDPLVESDEGVTNLTNDMIESLRGADGIILSTAHEEYREIDFANIEKIMRTPVIIDGRKLWSMEKVVSTGFSYRCVGVGTSR